MTSTSCCTRAVGLGLLQAPWAWCTLVNLYSSLRPSLAPPERLGSSVLSPLKVRRHESSPVSRTGPRRD